MELNPRQLEAFRKVMVTGSMTIAAERLKISQPAVSRLIKDLEKTLDIRLFRREGNRLIPGAEAQRLFREVDRFYQGMEQVERVAEDLKSVRIGTLRIGTMTALGLSLISEGVRRFSLARPGVFVSVDVRNSIGVLELTAANQIDIGFIHNVSPEYPGVTVLQLPPVASVCVVPRGHRLARKRVVKISDLHGESLISLGPNNPSRMLLEAELDAAGVVCRRPVETTLSYSACEMVAGGLGIAVADPYTAALLRGSMLVYRPLMPAVPFDVSIVTPTHQLRSKAVNDFIHLIKELVDVSQLKSSRRS